MKSYALAVGLLAAISAVPASATVLLDTLHAPVTPNSTRLALPGLGTGSLPRGGPIAESFYVPWAMTLTDVTLQLNANTPSDGGSVLVYLIPDSGIGGLGIAGAPTFTGSGNTLSLTGAIQIGSALPDSSLTNAVGGAPYTFTPSSTINLLGGTEYWLLAENSLGTGGVASSAKWVFDTTAYADSTGTADQATFWQAGGGANLTTVCTTAGAPCIFADTFTNNLYLAQVNAPEPVSIAVLGVGLTGIGIARRRRLQG